MVEFHMRRTGNCLARLARLLFFFRVQHLLNALGGGQRLGIHGEHPGDGQHGVKDNGEVGQESDNIARARHPRVHTPGAHRHHQHQPHIQQKLHGGAIDGHHGGGLGFAGSHCFVHLCKTLFLILGFGQGLDDANARHVFPNDANQRIHVLLQRFIQRHALLGNEPYNQRHKRQHGHQQGGKGRVQGHGNDNAADKQNGRANADALHHADHAIDIIGIRGHAGDQGRNSEPVDLPGGEMGDFAEQIVADRTGTVPGYRCGHPVGQNIAPPCQQGAKQHQPAIQIHLSR